VTVPDEPDRPRSEQDDYEERESRRLLELLNELRVALTGVQIMFAFLLTVPFTQRFAQVTAFQRIVYFVTLLCAAAATALLISPSAHHRMLFRRHQKHQLIVLGNTLTIVGLGFLALAMTGVILLITDVLFKTPTVVVVTALVATMFITLWYLVPLARRLSSESDEPHH
jgi:L-asparagine transporter-like permease